MDVLVLGAAGGVGRHAVTLATRQGHKVRAAARMLLESSPAVEAVALDVRDADAMRRAVDGMDAVLWCVGVSARSGPDVGRVGLQHLVDAAEAVGLPRVVTVSGAAVTLPGDRKGVGARLVSRLTRRLAHDLVADKEAEHTILSGSNLQWTAVRPPRLVEAAASGRWRLLDRAPGLAALPVARGDVAAAMLQLASSRTWLRSSPFIHRGGPARDIGTHDPL